MTKDIKDLFIDELNNIFFSEKQLLEAYPIFEEAAHSKELKDVFHSQFEEAKLQVERLGNLFESLNISKTEGRWGAIQGLIQECKDAIQAFPESALRDAALIARVQRIKHYEIAVYGTLVAFADELDYDRAIDLCRDCLDEEANADQKLTDLAAGGLFTTGINHLAHLT